MGNILADSMRAISLERSPLLADFGPGDRSWWRFVLGLLAAVAVLILLSIVLGLIIMVPAMFAMALNGLDPTSIMTYVQGYIDGDIEQTWTSSMIIFVGVAITNAVMMGVGIWVASLLVKKPLKLSFTTAPRWRWRQLFAGLLIYGIAAGALVGVDLVFGVEEAGMPVVTLSPSPLHMVIYAAVMIPAAILAAGAEELVFRGWLLRQSANLMRYAWLFLPFNGLLFSAIHLDFDPNAFLARAMMGMGFCWMALRLGGIEFSTGAHAINNILILLFIEPLTLTPPPPQPFDPLMALEIVVMFALMVAATEVSLRVPFLARLTGAPEPRPAS